MVTWTVSINLIKVRKEQIYSILNDENISDEQYKHAKKFGEDLNLKTWVTFMIFIYYLIFY